MEYLQPWHGLNGSIYANCKLMDSELDVIFSTHSAKQVHVLMNGKYSFNTAIPVQLSSRNHKYSLQRYLSVWFARSGILFKCFSEAI